VVLHAFGDYAQAEAVGEEDGGCDQCGGAGVVGHGEDEGAVELGSSMGRSRRYASEL
jgi:hypothetical protein